MRKNIIAFLTTIGSGIAALQIASYLVNYRIMSIFEPIQLYAVTSMTLYFLGVYVIALSFQLFSKRNSDIEPFLLVLGAVIGPIVLSLVAYFLFALLSALQIQKLVSKIDIPFMSPLFVLFVLFILLVCIASFCGVRVACRFEQRKLNFNPILLLFRISVPLILVLQLNSLTDHNFPGPSASAEIRHQWGLENLRGFYIGFTDAVMICPPIMERVGNVEIVAPTRGRNIVVYDDGFRGSEGEFTLEVIGEQGIGILNSKTRSRDRSFSGQFTYQKRTEIITCPR